MSTQTFAASTRADLLRLVLVADAAVTGANAVAYVAGALLLDSWLGVPAGALVAIGAFLAVYSALVLRVATRPELPRTAVAAVIAANAAWAVGSLLALASDAFTPTTGGQVWIAVQAVAVAGFAALQWIGLRRAPAAPSAG
jgi:hypothetical protein